MGAVERQRHVAAERQPADDRFLRADGVEDRGHVANSCLFAVGRLVGRVVALAMATHIPGHQRVLLRQRLDLALPHLRGRGIAVGQQDHRARAVDLVIDVDAVAVEFGHGRRSLIALFGLLGACPGKVGTGFPNRTRAVQEPSYCLHKA